MNALRTAADGSRRALGCIVIVPEKAAHALPARTELVYVDATAWDAASTKLLAQTLARELRPGAVVIHNTAHDYDGGEWRQLEALQLPTSWNAFHPIYVHLRE